MCEGQLPSLDAIHDYTGFLISGSHWASYDEEPWIKQLHQWIRGYRECTMELAQGPQMVGICFGHQAISDALGGRVALNSRFVIGTERVRPNERFAEKPYVRMAMAELGLVELPDLVHVLQSHGDAVHALPPGAELLASSPDTEVEMFTIGDRIMGIQGHPEFAPELLKEKILDEMVANGSITPEAAAEVERVMREQPLHHTFLRKVLQGFIKGKSLPAASTPLQPASHPIPIPIE